MTRANADEPTLDPTDWRAFRALAREMLDTTVADLQELPHRTGWRPLAASDKAAFRTAMPRDGKGLRAAYDDLDGDA